MKIYSIDWGQKLIKNKVGVGDKVLQFESWFDSVLLKPMMALLYIENDGVLILTAYFLMTSRSSMTTFFSPKPITTKQEKFIIFFLYVYSLLEASIFN